MKPHHLFAALYSVAWAGYFAIEATGLALPLCLLTNALLFAIDQDTERLKVKAVPVEVEW